MNLAQLQTGQKAVIVRVGGSGAFRKRILEMGFVQGKEITAVHNAPLKDPIYYKILDYNVSLRHKYASLSPSSWSVSPPKLPKSLYQRLSSTASIIGSTRGFAPRRSRRYALPSWATRTAGRLPSSTKLVEPMSTWATIAG